MTLLHQAAQKAVERVRHTLMTGLAHNDAIAALNEIVAMLPQHPDPETRPSMSMFASAADYNAAMDEWLAPPALQHQEVPREQDARSAFEAWHSGKYGRAYTAWVEDKGRYAWDLTEELWTAWKAALAASPSTTRQQEATAPLRHATKENGDCPHWCQACAAERTSRQQEAGSGLGCEVIDDCKNGTRTACMVRGCALAAAPSTPESAEKDDAGGGKGTSNDQSKEPR